MTPPRRIPVLLPALCAAAILLAACAGGKAAARKSEADARMRMGVTYLQQGNLPMAMRELMRASELDPDNAEIDMMLGLAYRARGDGKNAEKHLREAVDKRPDYGDAHNNLGIVLADRQAWEEAIREFETAAADVRYQTPEWAVYNAAEAYRAKGDAAKAEERYRLAIRMNEAYAPAYLGLAALLGKAGRWTEAETLLLKLVRIVPDYADGWMELGRVYTAMKRPADAEKAFKRVLESEGRRP
ncbi:MAG: tetratricopeptide repeat protein [Thermodesulfobacteriota bacterium]